MGLLGGDGVLRGGRMRGKVEKEVFFLPCERRGITSEEA